MSRIRANQITNQAADGAPTVQNGLIVSGVTTSTTFSGSGASLTNLPSAQLTGALPALDGSNLTGLSGVSVANQADNRLITATGTTDALNGEANLTWNGTAMAVGHSNPNDTLHVYHATDNLVARFESGDTGGGITLKDNTHVTSLLTTNGAFEINVDQGGDITGETISFKMSGSEKLRITSDGNVNINSSALSSPYSSHFRHLSINNNLILNAQNNAGGFAGMQNNAYLNSSGQWVRVNNDHATSIGTDDGNFYFRNVGAGTGNISWNHLFHITSSGNFGIATNSPVAQTLAGGTAITPVLDLKGTSQNNTSGVLQFTRKDNSTQGSCIYSSGDDAGLTFRNTDGNGFGFYTGTTLRFRITPSGYIKFGESNSGNVAFSLVTNGSGMLLSRATTGNPNNGQTLGDVGFNAYSDSQTTSSADALIRGQADGNFSGSSAPSALLFFTKPASTGPGSSPTERMRINKDGIITSPQQPMASTTCATQGTGYLGHSSVLTNQGGHFNTSNSRFVCPVSGYYLVSLMVMSNNSNATMDIELRKNNSNASNILVPYQAPTGGSYNQVSGVCIIDCAANDYLQFHVNNGSIYGGRHSAQCFTLLG